MGLPTYEAKELGLAKTKHDSFAYDMSVVITGNEINEYFRVLLKAMELVFPDLAAKTWHVPHGMLRLPSGKMSSRKGTVITADSLVDEVKAKVLEKMADRDMGEGEMAAVAELVAVAAIKYSILKQSPGRDIVFDFDKSLSFEGDSGPYLQYAAVRARSVLTKAEGEGIAKGWSESDENVPNLARLLARFPDIAARAREELAPNYIATYLIECAAAYNSYYADHKIVDANDAKSSYRVALTRAFAQTMENGLHILGIKAPERM
jgi:arginyl-tRNA synthetase